jgi:DNA-binding MarR family transcriptional regulator
MTLERCNCMALRKAARRVSNFYDSVLAPSGLRATQYSILALLSEVGAVSINDLARHLELDRTTTGKNLRPLRVAKLVKIAPSPNDGRSRLVTLTDGGMTALRTARPLWRRAQAEFESGNGKKLASDLRQLLSGLTVEV